MNTGTNNRIWLNIVLFVVTVFSAFIVGITWSQNYIYAETISGAGPDALSVGALGNPRVFLLSVLYAAVLMAILMGHELGHYLTCRHYGINATLPFFIPAPTLIGTLGAFIRIKSPITRKNQLFDIGAAGPLSGFILALPALVYGLSLSKVLPALPREETIVFGEPLLLKMIGALLFPHVPEGYDVFLHPLAFAGWVGVLVTSFNLFPVGQLDGGHLAYALFGSRAKSFSKVVLAVFFVLGVFFWVGWIVWALAILLLGLKHPRIYDESEKLSKNRRILGAVIVGIFILSFIPDPVRGYSLIDLIKQFMS
jgi:hypothetical protein